MHQAYLYGEELGCVSFYLRYRSPSPHSSRKNAHKINIMDVLVLEYKQRVSGHIDNRQQKHYKTAAHTQEHLIDFQ